jgi:hypothetical protein
VSHGTYFDIDAFWIGCSVQDIVYATLTGAIGPFSGSLNLTDFTGKLQNAGVNFIPLFPIPAFDDVIKSADVCVIEDAANPGDNTLALLLMFEDGPGGDKSAFTQSFVPQGADGAIEVDFGWLMRSFIAREINNALGLSDPNSLDTTGHLSGSYNVGGGVQLLNLDIGILPGSDNITAGACVQKSGFCYTVTGTTGATIIINITNGVLNVYPQLGATSVSTDIPWYCYLASAVLGGIIGGVIGFFAGGVIGLAVGAALGAAAGVGGLAAAQSGVTGVINSALSKVVNAINGDLPDIKQQLTGFKAVIQDVQVDDITFTNAIVPIESVPFKSGDLTIANNSYLDLDTGTVSASSSLAGADLSWTGSGSDRCLTPLGSIAKLAETGGADLSKIALYQLYQYSYKSDKVTIAQLGPAGSTAPVFGYRTDQFRYGCFQVTKAQDDSIQLRYKTYLTYQGPSTIQGHINDAVPNPVGNASVKVGSKQLTTDYNGFYSTSVDPCVCIVSVDHSGYASSAAGITVYPEATNTLDFVLAPEPITVKGTVTTATALGLQRDVKTPAPATGQNVVTAPGQTIIPEIQVPVCGATVTLSLNFENMGPAQAILSTQTDAMGSYSLTIDPGNYYQDYAVTVQAAGYVNAEVILSLCDGTVKYGSTSTQNFTLVKPTVLQGHVTDTGGKPVGGAFVDVTDNAGAVVGDSQLETDAGGFYSINIDPGVYKVSAVQVGFQASQASVTVNAHTTTTQDIVLESGVTGAIQGHVVDKLGNQVDDVNVKVGSVFVVTDSGGFYKALISPGVYEVVAGDLDYDPSKASVTVPNATVVTQDFTLTEKPTPQPGKGTNPTSTPGSHDLE